MGSSESLAGRLERLAPFALGAALAIAAGLLLWESRGVTFFVDEWSFGYASRTGWRLGELLEAQNGHLMLVPVVVTKLSLEVFGAGTTLPLRLLSIGLHLTNAVLLYLLLRGPLGRSAAFAPAVLVLFLGSAADLLIGSHGLPMVAACAAGLGSWLALERDGGGGDAVAAVLLCLGVASNGLALLFLAGAVALLALARAPRRRYWVVALPLALYGIWWLVKGGEGESDFAYANLAALPAFAFDSLAAELAALSGLFTSAGVRDQTSFDPAPGIALAGAVLVGSTALWIAGWRPSKAALPALVALLALWVTTGAVASAARQPESARYLYPGVILLFLLGAWLLADSPWRGRGTVALVAVCALGLLPNLRELHYGAAFFREQSDQDRAVLAAAAGLGPEAPGDLVLELEGDPGLIGVPDLNLDLSTYRAARHRYGSPAFSDAELAAATPSAQAAAARLAQRAAE